MRRRHVATLRGTLPVPPALAFARLRSRAGTAAAGNVVHEDASLWAVHVEGKWWFHGEWRFRPHADGCEVQLDVYSKTHGLGRAASAIPTRLAMRRLRRGWQARLSELAQA